jgi:thymidylate synthase
LLENDLNEVRSDRTGVGTYSVFGHMMRFDLSKGFPAQTTKKLAFKSVVSELLWFLEGSSDERRLAELTYNKPRTEIQDKTTIWTANADKQGVALGYENSPMRKELGPVYGVQWRDFYGSYVSADGDASHDQIRTIIKQLKTEPNSRRIILNAWNSGEISFMALPPCHVMSQFYVKDGKLSCLMTQRSADCFLGVPFNIASYALLTHILAKECSLDVGELIISLGDAHIYSNHIEQVKEVLNRDCFKLPQLKIDDSFDLELVLQSKTPLNYSKDCFTLQNYTYHDPIVAEMAV